MDLDAIKAISATLPTEAKIVRKGEGPGTSLMPGQDMRFPFYGSPEQPGIYIEHTVRGGGAPLHRHPWAGLEIVADGTVRFILGDREEVLNSGDFIYIPPDLPHTYVVESETARLFGVVYPGAKFMDLQMEVEPLFQNGPPDMPAVMKIAGKHGVEVLGPPASPKS